MIAFACLFEMYGVIRGLVTLLTYLIVTGGVPYSRSLTPEIIQPTPDALPGLIGSATVTCPATLAPAGPL